ncbi:deaminase domain-containing protein [Clostridium saccharoperbutylacetonicum]
MVGAYLVGVGSYLEAVGSIKLGSESGSSGKWITDTNKYSDDVIIPEEINDNTNVYSRDDADKYINTSISVFGRGISVGRKTYFANEISDLPKEIRYESGGYTYIYTLQEIPIFDGVFGSEPIYGMIITTKDDKVFNNKKYSYVLSYTDEPKKSIGVISVLPPEMPVEGIGSEVAANEAVKVASNADKLTSIINRVKEVRSELPSKLKKLGNFGYAEAEVDGIQQGEFFAHSSVDTVADKGALSGMSFKPEGEPIYKAQKVDPDNARIDTPEAYLRDYDTEYKILNDIVEKLKGNENATGTINLFTERYTCASCSDIILKFRYDHPNIKLNILTNDGKVVK